jgi:hypothetical protein
VSVKKSLAAWAFCVLALGSSGYFAYTRLVGLVPCAQPIVYSIGSVDDRFGITRDQFAEAVSQAAHPWEETAGKALFRQESSGGMIINAVYDHRQEAWQKMKELGLKADQSKQSYDALSEKHASLSLSMEMRRKEYEALHSVYDRKREAYEAALKEAQKHGITPEEGRALDEAARSLNADGETLNAKGEVLKETIMDFNAVVTVLNSLGRETNRVIDAFNQVGGTLEDEFDAGLYTRNASGEKIEIFAFEDMQDLKRLLTHELGHAIGLEHVTDSGSIMYYLNRSANEKLSPVDIAALRERCGL